ncbi:MAG: class II aldolase/adducin family protein [Gammaproteobacteria bacterium]|nr:class II aldolase/adducin family protein [Gammaproteobacteria bacterium]MDH3450446.1 class II aldolase/adducin family protein [Gammaproteobacteria bacterium]
MSKPDPQLVAGRCSEDEWQVRVQLAACYRAFVHYGWTDSIFTHLSARVPGHERQYLINPYGLLFHEICASNLIKVDFDGKVIDGDYPYNEAGHAIHTAMLKARPEVNVALHSHTRAGMAVSCMECGLLPLTQQANEIRDMLCYHEYGIAHPGSDECDRLGADMADKWIMVMHNHGLLTVGRSVAEAFYYLYTVENACKVQVDVLASGRDIVTPAPAIVDELAADGMARATESRQHVDLAWNAVLRLLERQDPSFRN